MPTRSHTVECTPSTAIVQLPNLDFHTQIIIFITPRWQHKVNKIMQCTQLRNKTIKNKKLNIHENTNYTEHATKGDYNIGLQAPAARLGYKPY